MFPLATFYALLASLMFVSYNGLNHPPGTAEVQFHFDAILNDGEQIVAYKARADIDVLLLSQTGSQADLTAQIQAVQEAYVNGGDLILVQNDGSHSANSIINSTTLGGTRVVVQPSVPDGKGTEYVTKRRFIAAIEAEIPTVDGGTALWSFEESVSFQGTGGPATDVIEVVQGLAVPQTLRQFTAATMVQEGRAVGYLGYWNQLFADPIYPSLEQQQFRFLRKGSPKRTGSGSNTTYKMFPSMWRYTFKSPTPLSAEPNVWPL